MMFYLRISNIAVITVTGLDYYCIIYDMANRKQFICFKIEYLNIVGICKMHVNIKNRICTCSKSSFESEKIETKNISID